MNKMKLEITGDSVDGNTKHPRALQLKHWFFTFNNYKSSDVEEMETLFNKICSKYKFQEETGKDGTHHLQGSIHLLKKMRWSEFNLSNKIHWEKTKNNEKADLYCCKEESRTGKQFSKGYPKPLKLIDENKLYDWQKDIKDLSLTEPDGRTVHWYYEETGHVGKSAFTKLMAAKYKTMFIRSGDYSNIMNLIINADIDNINMVIIDIPRNNGNKVSYTAIECILDGMITNTKYETGSKLFNPPHLVVFSNEYPEEDKLSADRWNIKQING